MSNSTQDINNIAFEVAYRYHQHNSYESEKKAIKALSKRNHFEHLQMIDLAIITTFLDKSVELLFVASFPSQKVRHP